MSPHTPPLRGSLPPEGADLARERPFAAVAGPHAAALRGSAFRARGFTLIELLVAVSVMALLAVLSWGAIDGMQRTQQVTQVRADELLRLQSALGQWMADLDAVEVTDELPALNFDGRVLRLTRRDSGETARDSAGLRVVAWGRNSTTGQWTRWQSPPLRQREELARAWQRSAQWGEQGALVPRASVVSGNGGDAASDDSVLALMPVGQWQLFFHRGETWGNPLSAVGNESTGGQVTSPLPNGVRLVLTLPEGQVMAGTLVRDWVRPTLEAGQ